MKENYSFQVHTKLENDDSLTQMFNEKMRSCENLVVSCKDSRFIDKIVEIRDISNYKKLLRVTALILRFTKTIRSKKSHYQNLLA